MAFIPVPDTVLVELVFTSSGSTVENTLYFTGTAAWDFAAMTDIAVDVVVWWTDNIRAMVPATVSLVAVRVTDLNDQFAPGIEFVVGLPLAGTNANPVLPNNVTVATTFLTALRGRSFRGRNYFVGMQEAMVVGDTLEAGSRGAIEAAYEAIPTDIDANGAQHVVVSRQSGGVPRVAGVTTPVTGYRTEGTVDSQRRRLAGRGQ